MITTLFSLPIELLLLFLALGLLAGFFAGTLGVGGGIIIVPALYWIFTAYKIDLSSLHTAIGTSLCIMIVTSLSASCLHLYKKRVVFRAVLWTTLGTALGAFLGPYTSSELPIEKLKTLLGLFEILMGFYLLFKNKIYFFSRENKDKKPLAAYAFILPGILIAYFSTLLGIGGGLFYVPLFLFAGYTVHQSVASSTLCIFPLSLIGTLIYLFVSQPSSSSQAVNWPAFFFISIGSLIASPLGAIFSYRVPQRFLRGAFACLLMVVGILFFI